MFLHLKWFWVELFQKKWFWIEYGTSHTFRMRLLLLVFGCFRCRLMLESSFSILILLMVFEIGFPENGIWDRIVCLGSLLLGRFLVLCFRAIGLQFCNYPCYFCYLSFFFFLVLWYVVVFLDYCVSTSRLYFLFLLPVNFFFRRKWMLIYSLFFICLFPPAECKMQPEPRTNSDCYSGVANNNSSSCSL